MKNVLNALYLGEIRPEEDYQPQMPEVIAALKAYMALQEELLAQLEEPVREKVLFLMEEKNALSALETQDAYVQGMRMGARLTAALLGEESRA